MTDTDAKTEAPSIRDLLKELRDGQKEANAHQAQTNVHLVQINGTLSVHEHGIRSHSGKLADQADRIADLIANQRVIMATTALQDEHQAQGIRNAGGDAWAAQQTAADVRTEAVVSMKDTRRVAIVVGIVVGGVILVGIAAAVVVVVLAFG